MKHRGTTLLETLVVISLSGIVLSLVATMLVSLWRVDRQWRRDLDERQSLARLEMALREDAHQALGAQNSSRSELSLNLDSGQTISYSVTGHQVIRLATSGESIRHRESFILAPGSDIALAIEPVNDSDVRLVRLTIGQAPAAEQPGRWARRTTVLEAALAISPSPATLEKGRP
jgi:type II secretory pathway pseudopilin PulG